MTTICEWYVLPVLIQQNTIKSKVLVCWTRNLNMLLWVYYVPLTGIFVIQDVLKGALIWFFFLLFPYMYIYKNVYMFLVIWCCIVTSGK